MTRINLIFLLGIVTIISFSSCSNNSASSDEIISIDLLDIPKEEKELKLSEFVESVEYVKLETSAESMFGPSNYIIGKEYILVRQLYNPTQLFLFDRSGIFLRKIGQEGKGPGEYISILHALFSPDEDYILVNDYQRKEFIEYSISGQVLRTIKYEEKIDESISSMRFLENNNLLLFISRPNIKTNNFHLIKIFDKDYNLIEEKFPINSENLNASGWSKRGPSFYLRNNKIHFREFFYDTLYVEEGDNLNAKYRFLIKRNPLPGYFVVIPARMIDFNYISGFSEIGDYFIILVRDSERKKSHSLIYNKETDKKYNLALQNIYDDNNTRKPAIFNDIDGFYHLQWYATPEKYICKALEIFELKEYIDNEYHLEHEILFPEKRQELVNLVKNSSENDNPILQIFYLKK